MKPAAEMIADAAGRHLLQRGDQHRLGLPRLALITAVAAGPVQQIHEIRRFGKLWNLCTGRAVAEPAVLRIELIRQRVQHVVVRSRVQLHRCGSRRLLQLSVGQLRQHFGVLPEFSLLLPPGFLH